MIRTNFKTLLFLLQFLFVSCCLFAKSYIKVTEIERVIPGAHYLIVGDDGKGNLYAMKSVATETTTKRLVGTPITLTDGVIATTDASIDWVLEQDGINFKIRQQTSYVNGTGEGAANVGTSGNSYTITKNEDGTYKLVITSNSERIIRFSTQGLYFAHYPSSGKFPMVYLYVDEDYVNAVFAESFDSNDGSGGNDGSWTGTSKTPIYDNNDWISEYVYGSKNCIRIGHTTYQGYVTTPVVNYTGNAILSFKAAAYSGDSKTIIVTSDAGSILGAETEGLYVDILEAAWKDCKVAIANSNSSMRLTFKANSKKRFFLDEVKIKTAFDLDVTSVGWASLYVHFPVKVPKGYTAFTAGEITSGVSTLSAITEGKTIPANTAVLVKGPEGIASFPLSEDTPESISSNILLGSVNMVKSISNEIYTLKGGSADNATFGLYTSNNLSAFKAYVPKATVDAAGGAANVRFVLPNEEIDGIMQIENSSLSIANPASFNLNGQRVNANAKGIVIVNGKKFINK